MLGGRIAVNITTTINIIIVVICPPKRKTGAHTMNIGNQFESESIKSKSTVQPGYDIMLTVARIYLHASLNEFYN